MSDTSDPVTRSLPAATAAFDPAATRTTEPTSPAPPPDLPPNYTLLGEIGRGAMGVVYRARQVLLNREVALKLILSGRHASSTQLARFLAEVQAAAAVDHPNVVRVHDSGEHAGTPYLAMELVSGGSLSEKLASGPLPPRVAAELVAKVADGVQAAHAAGIVHRDLKPGNILLAADGTPKVADFGLAKRADGSDLTHTGAILGTPGYMAPEQARGQGKGVGPPADVYALGAVLFACLAGRPPFVGVDPLDVAMKTVTEQPNLRRVAKGIPRDLETIVAKCLSKDPAGRYPTAGELAADLRRWLTGEPILARQVGWVERGFILVRRKWLAVAFAVPVAVVLCVLAGFVYLPWETPSAEPAWVNRPLAEAEADVRTRKSVATSVAELFLANNKQGNGALSSLVTSEFERKSPFSTWKLPFDDEDWSADRPYYSTESNVLGDLEVIDAGTVRFRGTGRAEKRYLGRNFVPNAVRTGGVVSFTLTLQRKDPDMWLISQFVCHDRGSIAGPIFDQQANSSYELPDLLDLNSQEFKPDTWEALEGKRGLKWWTFFYTGGSVRFRLTADEPGKAHVADLMQAEFPGPEGQVFMQFGRVIKKEAGEVSDEARWRMKQTLEENDDALWRMTKDNSTYLGQSAQWYGWKGVKFVETIQLADLSDGKEHEVLVLTAIEKDPEEGKEPRKVVLRVLAKKLDKK